MSLLGVYRRTGGKYVRGVTLNKLTEGNTSGFFFSLGAGPRLKLQSGERGVTPSTDYIIERRKTTSVFVFLVQQARG